MQRAANTRSQHLNLEYEVIKQVNQLVEQQTTHITKKTLKIKNNNKVDFETK